MKNPNITVRPIDDTDRDVKDAMGVPFLRTDDTHVAIDRLGIRHYGSSEDDARERAEHYHRPQPRRRAS